MAVFCYHKPMNLRNFSEVPGSDVGKYFEQKQEKPQQPWQKIEALMQEITSLQNQEAKDLHGLDNLLDSEGQINAESYREIFGDYVVDESNTAVNDYEIEFSSADDLTAQRNYKADFGIEGTEAIIEQWQKEKRTQKNYQMELAVTALLHKILGEEYFVLRTSKYDDYRNGIDTLIVNKATGVVVCAFDEVHEGGDGTRTSAKQLKVLEKAEKGGVEVRFGLAMEQGKLKRSELKNLPVFYLGLSSAELTSLMQNMTGMNEELSEQESAIYKKLVGLVREQLTSLGNNKNLDSKIKWNLIQSSRTLSSLESFAE